MSWKKVKVLKIQVWVHLSGLRIHFKVGGQAWLTHIQEEEYCGTHKEGRDLWRVFRMKVYETQTILKEIPKYLEVYSSSSVEICFIVANK